jgi:hypothetical protein
MCLSSNGDQSRSTILNNAQMPAKCQCREPYPLRRMTKHPWRELRSVYFSFFALAPLTLAVPRRVFCRFLRCLPVCKG